MSRQESQSGILDKMMRAASLLDYRQLRRAEEIKNRPAPEKPKTKPQTVEDFIQRAIEIGTRNAAIEMGNIKPDDEHPQPRIGLTIKGLDGTDTSFNWVERIYGQLPDMKEKTLLAADLAREKIAAVRLEGGNGRIMTEIIDYTGGMAIHLSPETIKMAARDAKQVGITPFPISTTQNKPS